MFTIRGARPSSLAAMMFGALVWSGCADSTAPSVEIVLSEPSVELRAVRGATSPVSTTITVENGGDGRLGPVACPTNPVAWLSCAVANGNAVTFTANPTGLTSSPAPAQVAITAAGAPDRPRTVTVSLVLDQPILSLSASAVSFTANEGTGGTTPAATTVTVTNTGAGTLASLGTITCQPMPANARVTCGASASSGVLTISVDPAGLAPGTYLYPVVVSAPNGDGPRTITVSVAVAAVPRIVLSRQAIVFDMLRGGSAPPSQTVTVSNSGGGSLGTVSCPAAPAAWLACSVSGSTVTLTANPTGLTVSPAGVTVPVSATGATNSPQSVAVNLNIRQPVLSVSAASVAFTAVAGGSTTTPGSATVTVSNTGEGTLASLGTITCVPPEGSPVTCTVTQATGELKLVVNPAGIVGTKLYAVTVSAANSGVSRVVTVSLSAPPGIALSPKELNFQAIRGSTTAIVKKVKVANQGNGTLGTIACPASPAAWLTCAVIAGDTLVVTANPTGLTASPTEVEVPVTAANATNNPQLLTVNFAILQPVLSVSAPVVNLTVAAGGTTTPGVVTVTNSGAGVLANLGTIACTPSDAHVACVVNQAAGTVSITVNTATAPALVAGKYVYTVAVTAPNATGSQTVTVVLTVT